METAAQMNGSKRTWADSALMTFVRFAFAAEDLQVAVDHFQEECKCFENWLHFITLRA